MRKVLLLIAMLLFIASPVYAKENKLYFTESGKRMVYKSKLLDEEYFLKHDLVPGEKFTDELLIENGTKTKYTLYFKIMPREQSAEANKLLEEINMQISVDGNIIYEGKATGLNYDENGINLQEAILLGDFDPSKESKMIVETTLSEEYSNTDSSISSFIDWQFYAQYDDSVEVINPDTGDNVSKYLIIALSCGLVIIIAALLYSKKVKHI